MADFSQFFSATPWGSWGSGAGQAPQPPMPKGPQVPPEVIAALRARLGLDEPAEAQDAAEAAAARVRAPYTKANERQSGLPDIFNYYANKLSSAVTAPRDALTGAMQVTDPETGMPTREAMDRGQGVANLAMTGGLPFAKQGAAGMAGGKLGPGDFNAYGKSKNTYTPGSNENVPGGGKGTPQEDVDASLARLNDFLAPYNARDKFQVLKGGAEEKPAGTLSDFITAYHGSPHDFDRFDLSKIGTGEGAQAYGHGLYFAENEGVARDYRNALSPRDIAIHSPIEKEPISTENTDRYGKTAIGAMVDSDGTFAGALQHLIKQASDYSDPNHPTRVLIEKASNRIKEWQEVGAVPKMQNPGRMYQVAIKSNPEHFLDWDKPLSEQSPKVRDAFKRAYDASYPKGNKELRQKQWDELQSASVEHLVRRGGIAFDDERASKLLRDAGIPGIKYLDQGSRPGHNNSAAGNAAQDIVKFYGGDRAEAAKQFESRISGRKSARQGEDIPFRHDRPNDPQEVLRLLKSDEPLQSATRNFVVFDDKLIDILKKYGIAGIGALPAMNAYHYQDKGN
jgi:hypothetical protein